MSKLYQIKVLDRKLRQHNDLKTLVMPRKGWINTIRRALSMSQQQLAKRTQLHRSRIKQIEDGEVEETITLATLKKMAKGLGCELHYVLLPKVDSLTDLLTLQAKKIAKIAVLNAAQHMVIEDQNAMDEIEEQVNTLAEELLHKQLKRVWDDKN